MSAQAPETVELLSAHTREEIDHWLTRFPTEQKRSAILGGLRAAQHQNNGYVTAPLMDAVADYIGVPAVQVYEVAAFYSMIETKPVGRISISVCNNVSCMLRGSDEVTAHLEKRLGIKRGESTPDGKFYLKPEEECLAACTGAPMMMVDHVYYEYLTPAKIDEILDSLA